MLKVKTEEVPITAMLTYLGWHCCLVNGDGEHKQRAMAPYREYERRRSRVRLELERETSNGNGVCVFNSKERERKRVTILGR